MDCDQPYSAATQQQKRAFIEAMARHLPPGASTLTVLDVNGEAAPVLAALRDDLRFISAPGDVKQWGDAKLPENADAILAYAYVLNEVFLAAALALLRPGGRLIVVYPRGEVSREQGQRLESAGYARILVEEATHDADSVSGVLVRGERPHATSSTAERVAQVARADADMLDLATYRGHYVHLLIRQAPNKPVWRMEPDEAVTWEAVAIEHGGETFLLAFSSLPKAVGFMQPAVLAGRIHDVNKVGKFSRVTAGTWNLPVLLNPLDSALDDADVTLIPIDPATAEASDE